MKKIELKVTLYIEDDRVTGDRAKTDLTETGECGYLFNFGSLFITETKVLSDEVLEGSELEAAEHLMYDAEVLG